jgi:hypothetical protein
MRKTEQTRRCNILSAGRTYRSRVGKVKKIAAAALTAVLAAAVAACSSGAPPRPRLAGGVSATCKLFWTYQSAHGIPQYPSFAAAYKADLAEYRQPPGSLYQIMPVLQPMVRITARSTVNIGSIKVVFYDNSGDETGHSTQLAVNKILKAGHSYTAVAWSGLSDPGSGSGDTNVASCAVAAWTRRLTQPTSHAPANTTTIEAAARQAIAAVSVAGSPMWDGFPVISSLPSNLGVSIDGGVNGNPGNYILAFVCAGGGEVEATLSVGKSATRVTAACSLQPAPTQLHLNARQAGQVFVQFAARERGTAAIAYKLASNTS